MATLTSLLILSKNALDADQTALNVTANNVANQNTPGYTRQRVDWQAVDSVTLGNVHYGQGVTTGVGPVSVRDRVLEQRVQQQTQTAAQSSSLVSTLNLVQNVFGISSTATSAAATSLGTAIDGLFNAFTTLEANPSDPATRSSVLSQASNLAQNVNAASAQLTTETSSLNVQVGSTVQQVNSLLGNIADLNRKIATVSPNSDAGALEDSRQLQIAKLSQFIGLDQITTDNNGITLTTTGGALLVGAARSFPLATGLVGQTNHVYDANSNDITGSISGGTLGGLLQARDTTLPGFSAALDKLAYGIGTAVNTQNAAGLALTGAPPTTTPGGPLFFLPATFTNAAAQITLAPAVDANSIAAASTTEGVTGASNAAALAGLASGNIVNGQTASGSFAAFLSNIGSVTSAASSDNTVQQAALSQLTSQRNSVSSVSLDEEAANLTQYQRSYEAAAKIFTIIDSLLAVALNLGTQTSFS